MALEGPQKEMKMDVRLGFKPVTTSESGSAVPEPTLRIPNDAGLNSIVAVYPHCNDKVGGMMRKGEHEERPYEWEGCGGVSV